jgi:hypothetical protein
MMSVDSLLSQEYLYTLNILRSQSITLARRYFHFFFALSEHSAADNFICVLLHGSISGMEQYSLDAVIGSRRPIKLEAMVILLTKQSSEACAVFLAISANDG